MKKKRGIILISTLLLIFFLVLVASAFININTNNLRLTTNVRDQELATLAAMSGVTYARMRLEQYKNKDFALNSWGGNTDVLCSGGSFIFDDIPSGISSGTFTVTENESSGVVRGILTNSGAEFRLAFACAPTTETNDGIPASYNNLWSNASNPRSGNLRNIPQRSVHLIVVGSAGSVSRTVEVILKKQALTDSSAFAGNDLKVDITGTDADSLWYINSVDPFDNSVRANGNITAPTLGNPGSIDSSMATGTFNSSFTPGFTFTGGNTADMATLDPNKVSLGAIVSKNPISFKGTVVGEGGLLGNDDNETIFAKQQTGGVLHPNTKSQSPPDLSASNFTPASSKCIYTIGSGVYTITDVDTIKLPDGTLVGTVPFTANASCSATPPSLAVKDYMLRIPKDINIQVNGNDFTLQLDPLLGTDKRAKLGLGYDSSGYQATGEYPIFHVKGGNITVSGELTGEGGIVADEDGVTGKGKVTLEGRSVLSTDPSSGVAIYADADVNINQITYTGATSGNTDFTAYKNAIAVAAPNNYLSTWGNKSTSWRNSQAVTLTEKQIGTASWDGSKLNISFTSGGTASITIPSGSIYKNTAETTNFGTLQDITLGQYVRAKYKEDHAASTILTSYNNIIIGKYFIKPEIDSFWSDKENIESQVASALENLKTDKVEDDTILNDVFGSSYTGYGCYSYSSCKEYEDVKDKDILVSFADYWKGSTAAKFSNVNQKDAYESNYKVYWSQSKMTSAQELFPQDAEFTGVIYTKGNLIATMGTSTTNYKFFIEGSVVSLTGDIDIKYANKVQFLYNPEYLTTFMNQTGGSVQTRLTQVFWVMW